MNESPRKVSPLRQRMIEEMRMRQLAPKTRDAYINHAERHDHGAEVLVRGNPLVKLTLVQCTPPRTGCSPMPVYGLPRSPTFARRNLD